MSSENNIIQFPIQKRPDDESLVAAFNRIIASKDFCELNKFVHENGEIGYEVSQDDLLITIIISRDDEED